MKQRIAVAENFNGTKKVEVFYDATDSHFELKFTKCNELISIDGLPKEFVEEAQQAMTDVVDMKGRYRAI